jgi:hypothetical protein
VLSLILVPAMFLMMDDFGRLAWRYGTKLLVSSGVGADASDVPPVIDHK